MNSPISFQDLSSTAPLDLSIFEGFLPPGNPFSLESSDFEVFLPPGNPFSLESLNFEDLLSPGNPFLADAPWLIVFQNAYATPLRDSDLGDLPETDVLTANIDGLSPWLVLSDFGEDDGVIGTIKIESPDDYINQEMNLRVEEVSDIDISLGNNGASANFPIFRGILSDLTSGTESNALLIGLNRELVQNLDDVLNEASVGIA